MGRSPCCDESGLKKGPWTPEEDHKLVSYINKHGHASWRPLPKLAGLNRCGKSCRLRWTNYLRPNIKRGKISPEEEQTILNLHAILGNKWSAIATRLPGRTDNEIKNFWNTHLKKKLIQMGFDPVTHRPRTDIFSSLPHLIALTQLKELIENPSFLEDQQQVARLHTEVAKLHCLQFLLQPPSSSYSMPSLDLDSLNVLFNCIPLQNPVLNLDGSNPFHGVHDRLPDLQSFELPATLTKETIASVNNNINVNMVSDPHNNIPCDFTVLNQGDFTSPTSPWLPSLSSSPSPPPPPPAATSEPPVDGCSASGSNNFWPELLLEESLFHEIA